MGVGVPEVEGTARRGGVRLFSVAPMMDRTDRHFRYFARRLTRRALLYTEMVVGHAVLRGDRERLLGFDPEERPLALQLGGDDPAMLAECARIAEGLGYDEVNLNVGCPSDRVQDGRFGVCLMAQPERVAEAVAAMRAAARLPVTVKHRIGFDDHDRYEDMLQFVDRVAAAGCDRFVVHARKAWLRGLSPRENRQVPPLRYDDVRKLKQERGGLIIEVNGGIRSLDTAREFLRELDGVMLGRAAYDDPYLLARVDAELFGEDRPTVPRAAAAEQMISYLERWTAAGVRPSTVLRPLANLFRGCVGAADWRRRLGAPGAGGAAAAAALREAVAAMADRGY